jgi:hypothetical protein
MKYNSYKLILDGNRNTKEIIDEVQRFGASIFQIDVQDDEWIVENLPDDVIRHVKGIYTFEEITL